MEIMFDKVTALFLGTLSDAALAALRSALESDDERLIQGATTSPPPLMCVQDWPVEGACLVGYGCWQGDGLETVGEVEEFFARSCFELDKVLGEPGGCRHMLNGYDEMPRDEMLSRVLALVIEEEGKRCLKNF